MYSLVSKVITLPKVSEVFSPFPLYNTKIKRILMRLLSLAYINKSQNTEKNKNAYSKVPVQDRYMDKYLLKYYAFPFTVVSNDVLFS